MRITIHKRLLAILMAAVVMASAAVGVSAENYVDISDSGIWKYYSSGITELVRPIQSTSSLGTVSGDLYFGFEIPMQKNFTYKLVLEFTNVRNKKSLSPETDVLLADSAIGALPTVVFDGAVITYSYEDTGSAYHHTYNILFNWSWLDSNKWIYFLCKDVFLSFQINNLGLYCVYDPGGSYYEKAYAEYLSDIRDQLHAGDDKLDNIPSNSDFSNSVSSIDSAEASLISASDPNGTALSDFSAKGKTTVTAVNTTYRQTFAFINSMVTKVMDDLDFGALVFLALTLGLIAYILGRIK